MLTNRCLLLHSRDPGRCQRWELALANLSSKIVTARDLLSLTLQEAEQLPDIAIVLTDEPVDLSQLGFPRGKIARHEIGLVALGCETDADVNLPLEATDREIQLACRLLAEVVVLRQDLGRHRQQQVSLLRLAETDVLTGLPNRRVWEAALKDLATNGMALADADKVIAILDIDGFKHWNDQLGHGPADERLSNIARNLCAAVRKQDLVARWGGDEFALLLNDLPARNGPVVVERIRRCACLTSPEPITLSAGCAALEESTGSFLTDAAFQAADAALRAAKQAGGNQTRCAADHSSGPPQAAAG
jgi:diguanylate cyclase (GGDEF)-like protein